MKLFKSILLSLMLITIVIGLALEFPGLTMENTIGTLAEWLSHIF